MTVNMNDFAKKVLLVVCLLLAMGEAWSQLELDGADSPFVIEGLWGGEKGATTVYSGSVQFRNVGKKKVGLRGVAGDLVLDSDSSIKIKRTAITVPNSFTLQPDNWANYSISIKGAPRPGTYTGILKLDLPEGGHYDTLDIKLVLKEVPVLEPVVTEVNGEFVLPTKGINILPGRFQQEFFAIQFHNPGLQEVEITEMGINLSGTNSPNQRAASNFKYNSVVGKVKGGDTATVKLIPKIGKLSPDHYTGTCKIRIKDQNRTLISVPLDFKVRSGPFCPIVVIVIGILLGRGVALMEDKRKKLQIAYYEEINVVERLKNQLISPDSQAIFDAKVAAFRNALTERKLEDATLKGLLDKIKSGVAMLIELDALEAKCKKEYPVIYEKYKANFSEARELVEDDKVKEAKKKLEPIEAEIKTDAATLGDPSGEGLEVLTRENIPTKQEESGWEKFKTMKIWSQVADVISWILAKLSGHDILPIGFWAWVVRPVFTLLTLGLLVTLGFWNLYVEGSATFGSDGIGDYLGLILWAMGSQIAAKNLGNLNSITFGSS